MISNCAILIDYDDLERVSSITWTVCTRFHGLQYKKFISGHDKNNKTIVLHRFIMEAPPDKQVDHINHLWFDNSRANLRLCTALQNSWNKRYPPSVGVIKVGNRYRAKITCRRIQYHLGYFSTFEEAKEAYNKKAIELFEGYRVIPSHT
jgi:hypothetical protein